MISRELVAQLIEERIQELNNGLYVVELSISPSNVIHVELDKLKGGVSVNDCVSVSRNVEHNLDREKEDFELHVSSAGLDKPFRHENQYAKNIGRTVKTITKSGEKYEGTIAKLVENGFVLLMRELKIVDGKKRKEWQESVVEIPFNEVKETKIVITFK